MQMVQANYLAPLSRVAYHRSQVNVCLRGCMRFLTVILMGLAALPGYASTQVDLFSAEVALSIGDSADEQRAREAGLQQVLVRASGDSNVGANPVVQKALHQSASFLSQISYGERAASKTLQMVFNPPQIKALLTKAQLPYWPAQRSSLVVWLVQEGRLGREVLWEQSGSELVELLHQSAAERGLPVTVPVGDFQDVTRVTATDLWGDFLEPVANGSARYAADAVLIVKIQNYGSRNRIRWALYDTKPESLLTVREPPQSGELSGAFDQTLPELVDQVTRYYADKQAEQRFSYEQGLLTIDFVAIRSAEDFFALERLLSDLQTVAGVDLKRIVADRVTFQLHLMAAQSAFESELGQSRRLRRVEQEFLEQAPELEVGMSDNVQVESEMSAQPAETVIPQPLSGTNMPFSGEVSADSEQVKPEPAQPVVPVILFEWLG